MIFQELIDKAFAKELNIESVSSLWKSVLGLSNLPAHQDVLAYGKSAFGYVVICKNGHGNPYAFSMILAQRQYAVWKIERYKDLDNALDMLDAPLIEKVIVEPEDFKNTLAKYEQLRPVVLKGYYENTTNMWQGERTIREHFVIRRYRNGALYKQGRWKDKGHVFAKQFLKELEENETFTITEGTITDELKAELQSLAVMGAL